MRISETIILRQNTLFNQLQQN